jgi:hypothetical protein
MPYDIGSGGTLSVDNASEIALAQHAVQLARDLEVNYLELRYLSPRPQLETLGFVRSEPVVLSDLELNEKSAWSRVEDGQRRAVLQAERRGVTVREGKSLKDFKDFERVILHVFRDFGTPPYGPHYFETLWRRLQPSGEARVVLADVDNRCVAGLLLFCSGGTLVAKIGGCLPDAVPLRATAALYWRTIQLATELGYSKISWGTSAHNQTGLIKFKERWGSKSHPVSVYSMPIRGEVPDISKYYDSTGIERRIWSKLPIPLTQLGGSLLSRWFC